MSEVRYDLAPPQIARSRPDTRQAASDETLIGRIAVGDGHAMRALYVRHNVHVFRFLLGKVKERMIAEDLVSEVFVEVWQSAHRFGTRAAVPAWLLAIARYKAFSAMRRHQTRDQLDQGLAIEHSSKNPKTAIEIQDPRQVLCDCLSNLSPSQREILDLAYHHKVPIESVAEIVGIPVNTVKTRMFHARRHLAALLLKAGIDRASLSIIRGVELCNHPRTLTSACELTAPIGL